MTKEQFFTRRWNNVLALVLGLVFVAYAVVIWSIGAMSDMAAFLGLVVLGVFY